MKVGSNSGEPHEQSAARGLEYAAFTGADVVSMSFGFPSKIPSPNLVPAMNLADAMGVTMVSSMPDPEHVGDNPFGRIPEEDDRVISVAMIYSDGDTAWHDPLDATGVVAPGKQILTTDIYHFGDDPYSYVNGTSFACPLVAAVATMAISRRRSLIPLDTLTPHEVRQIIWNATDDATNPHDPTGFDEAYGRGRVNFEKAMLAVSRGDANNDGIMNVSDVIYIQNYVFSHGPEPQPHKGTGDCNCDGLINITDMVWIIQYAFNNGPAPYVCYEYNY